MITSNEPTGPFTNGDAVLNGKSSKSKVLFTHTSTVSAAKSAAL